MKRQALGLSGDDGGLRPEPGRPGMLEPSPSSSRQAVVSRSERHMGISTPSGHKKVTRMHPAFPGHQTSAEGRNSAVVRLRSLMPAQPVISSGLLNKRRKEAAVTGLSPECQHPVGLSCLRHIGALSDWLWALVISLTKRKKTRYIFLKCGGGFLSRELTLPHPNSSEF